MYVTKNPRTKKQLREWVSHGKNLRVYDPGPFDTKPVGMVAVEGPHYMKESVTQGNMDFKDGHWIHVVNDPAII